MNNHLLDSLISLQNNFGFNDHPNELSISEIFQIEQYTDKLRLRGLQPDIWLSEVDGKIYVSVYILIPYEMNSSRDTSRLSMLKLFIEQATDLKFMLKQNLIQVEYCVAQYDYQSDIWDADDQQIVKSIEQFISSIFNENVLSEDVFKAIDL